MDRDQIVMYGTTWCGATWRARQIMDRNNVPYQWIDIDRDREGCQYVESVNRGCRSVPTILFPDGSLLVEPSEKQLCQKLGL